jgi:hypothetical protein
MAINFGNIDSIISAFSTVLRVPTFGIPTTVPIPLLLLGAARKTGLSPTKIASRIITRKSEAGIPVGALESGGVAPDEIMERIRVQELIRAFQTEGALTVVIPPGQALTAAGTGPTGPVTVFGATITPISGFAQIQ